MKPFSVLLAALLTVALAGEKKPCCGPTATEAFAAFGNDKAFVALHDAPESLSFQPSRGELKKIKTADGEDAVIFEVTASVPTKKYLFLFHEWWGMNDYIKREAEKLQHDLGNVTVIALDLYDGKIAATPDSARSFVGRVQESRARAIIAAAAEYVGSTANIATLGWCFGGGWSMQAALMLGKQAVGCVIYYGMPEKDVQKLNALNCSVLGIFATQDGFINPQIVSEFEANMKLAKKDLTVKNFDAVHAFANPSNPKHDKEKSAVAYAAAVSFLRTSLNIK